MFFKILIIISSIILSFQKYPDLEQIPDNITKWMSYLPDDIFILLMNIPGAHDSAANEMLEYTKQFAQTQNMTIPDLLKIGIREFDIRVALFDSDPEDIDDNLHTCHGEVDCLYTDEFNVTKNLTFKHILLDIKTFLKENPSETVILWTQSEKGDCNKNIKRAVELMDKYIGDIFVKYDKNLKLGNVRGKIISTVYKYYDEKGNEHYHKGFDGGSDLEEIHRKFIDKEYYSSWEVTGEIKIQEVLEFLRTYNISIKEAEENFKKDINKYPYNYPVSCTGEHETIIPKPKKQADIVNPFLLDYDFIKGYYYGWIEMDFANLELAKKFIDTNIFQEKKEEEETINNSIYLKIHFIVILVSLIFIYF